MTDWADQLAVDDPASPGTVVCLPDIFLDHLVPLEDQGAFLGDVQEVARRGGGNRLAPGQRLKLGGNAANLAQALARLGVDAALVAPTDAVGALLARRKLEPLGVDLEGVREAGAAAHTVALEFPGEDGANVMLSDPGPLTSFGPDDLAEADHHRIRSADAAAVTNWAKTRPGGTALLEAVAELADGAGTDVYLDTSDPTTRPPDEVEAFVASEALAQGVDTWGMNEHEARTYAEAAGLEPGGPAGACQELADATSARVDVHSEARAWTSAGGEPQEAPAFDVEPRHRTGAGDAWNAGNVLSDLLGLHDRDRLQVAHAVAALAVRDGRPPTRDEAAGFLEERGRGRA